MFSISFYSSFINVQSPLEDKTEFENPIDGIKKCRYGDFSYLYENKHLFIYDVQMEFLFSDVSTLIRRFSRGL